MTSSNNILATPAPNGHSLPAWLDDMRSNARDLLPHTPLPDQLDESWRFGNRKGMDFSGFSYADSTVTPVNIARLCANSLKIVIVNDRIVEIPNTLPTGLTVSPLSAVNASISEQKENPTYLRLLHNACLREGILIEVDQHANISPVIEIIYAVSGDKKAVCPHTVIHAGDNSGIKLLERHISLDGEEHLCLASQHLSLASNAHVDYALLQQLNVNSRAVELQSLSLKGHSRLNHFVSHHGGGWIRQELTSSLTERGAHAELLSANPVNAQRVLDQRTYQDHQSPGCYSNLMYKNVLDDSAKTVFSGMIKVEPGAHETDAYQSNKNLMLSDQAEANSMPGLEILADNVKCSHGSAVSAIDADEIFYLQSRGIHPHTAQNMIAEGFLSQAVEHFEAVEIIEAIKSVLF